jgi:hypothetical protein
MLRSHFVRNVLRAKHHGHIPQRSYRSDACDAQMGILHVKNNPDSLVMQWFREMRGNTWTVVNPQDISRDK